MRKAGFTRWLIVPIVAAAIAIAGCATMAGAGGMANGAANQNQMQAHHPKGYGM